MVLGRFVIFIEVLVIVLFYSVLCVFFDLWLSNNCEKINI